MKIIFLDIEGVLSVSGRIDPLCCARLKQILDSTQTNIVLSSSWRLYDDDFGFVLSKIAKYGIDREYFVDKTPSSAKGRAYEIYSWLQENPEVIKYVVLDDNDISDKYIPKDNFVQTDSYVGLSNNDMELCVKILGKEI
ncbi:MAG: HAD domain-containing protein [Firmicutes bacterium]|nr:HAD domain-containing protein [Bacillota bacterium]MCL1953874.1 HAD domain-containing protein [Bacillota bacterium]